MTVIEYALRALQKYRSGVVLDQECRSYLFNVSVWAVKLVDLINDICIIIRLALWMHMTVVYYHNFEVRNLFHLFTRCF